MGKDRVEVCVESICNKGCQSVRSDLEKLEQRKVLPELKGFSEDEIQRVLRELKSIMEVYGDSCRLPGQKMSVDKESSG